MECKNVSIFSSIKYYCPSCGKALPSCSCKTCTSQQNKPHKHKFFGFTELADRHVHHFSGYTSQVIPKSRSHAHEISIDTNSTLIHQHKIGQKTETVVSIGKGKHIHIVKGVTTLSEGHVHDFVFTTLIEKIPHKDI